MPSLKRSLNFWATLLTTLGLLAPVSPSYSQAVNPTPDQIDMFRNLSPDQQDAILRSFSSGGGSGSSLGGGLGSSLGGSQFGGSRELNSDRQAIERQRSSSQEMSDLEPGEQPPYEDPKNPALKAEDSVIIEVDFTLPARATLGSANVPFSTQGGQGAQQGVTPQQPALGPLANNAQVAASASPNNPGKPEDTASQLNEQERKRLQDLIDLIRSRNPYKLSRSGELTLPGFYPIPLLGLTDEQATLRLKVEPAFQKLDIRLTRLPLRKTGVDALKPFGYDLFQRAPSTFSPVTNVPVPADYVVGSGDELDIQLYGSQNRALRLIVGRDGRINLPELGPIHVGGELFSAAKSEIESRVEHQMIGVRAAVSMGDTRAIRVFVLGEAKRPGSYVVSGLGSITSALFAAGGVKSIGSLRKIQLKRQGTVVRTLDLYDLLIRGDTTDDSKLLQGDVVFVPPVGATISIDGEVRRPAIYEIRNESNIADVIQLAGGLTSEADNARAMLTRIDEQQRRVVIPIDLSPAGEKTEPVRNGDLLRVFRLRPTIDSAVALQGHVFTPGNYAYRKGMHLSDVIHSVDDLRPNADLHYVLIRRESPTDRRISVLSPDLAVALFAPHSAADPELMPRDRITIFDVASGRDHVIQPLLDELKLQGNPEHPTQVVRVDGRVRVPGEYPLEQGMTVADLIRAGGGLTDAAYGGQAELTRYKVANGETRRTDLINIDLAAAMHTGSTANVVLEPFDNLSVKEVSQWNAQESIVLTGEIRFPGRYAIKRGETLKSVMDRAGGLTDAAFAEGSVFTREELKKREQEQLDMLATRMQTDLTAIALGAAAANQGGAPAALQVGQTLLGQLRSVKAVGRLVIDLPTTMKAAPGSPNDVILRDGDRLLVPKFQQQVTVIGEVQSPTSHLYSPRLSRDDYIGLSGGATRRADRSKIYIVHANGSVVSSEGNRWFERSMGEVKPGDTIVVPLDMERMPALPFWTAVTTIIYNVAIAAAAVHSF